MKGTAMRYKHVTLLVLVLLPLLSGCHSDSAPLPIGTFINQSDPSQVLELKLDPSKTSNVLIRMSIEMGTNKYVGKSVGTYTLKTKHENSKGTFAYIVISWERSKRDDRLHKIS